MNFSVAKLLIFGLQPIGLKQEVDYLPVYGQAGYRLLVFCV